MPLYRSSVAAAKSAIEADQLTELLIEQYRYHVAANPSPSEVRSWDRSIRVLVDDLVSAGLSESEILLEYQLPLSSRRVDAIVCGLHPRTGDPSYVVVELKQWTDATLVDGAPDVVRVANARGDRLHPIAQVERYCEYLADFLASLQGSAKQLHGVAYLHNATDRDVEELRLRGETDHGRLFTGQRRGEFVDFLKSKLRVGAGVAAADELLNSAVRPSKQLMELAAEEVQRREQFILLDEQQVAYQMVMRAVEKSMRGSRKQVIVISGGPGSGKSVIALSLLGELARQGRTALHATGSSAFTNSLRKIAAWRSPRVRKMFVFCNSFIDAEPNAIDTLIVDEAHRIRETSNNRYTKASLRTGRPQVEELIEAARVPVFLLDEHQVVRPNEVGTVSEIESAAARLDCEVVPVNLNDQFRCGGSRVFEDWVLRLLGLSVGGPVPWEGDENFVLDVADGPSPMEETLRIRLNEGYSARIAAGYCWKWSKEPAPDGTLRGDVVVGDWQRPWNNPKDSSAAGAPARSFWATDPAGFGQVGCVYTAQGFEYDYGGVIMGPDLVWRTDHWEARPEFSQDSQVKKADLQSFDRAVRNTYKVLLTRAMRGMALYSTDSETQRLLHSLIS
ncbi:DUF2075 domain-containing protein [Jongsikchunia kroppenstedtii]|uniref:DUF2075 domain-containing protein n=1 Tax=Jongsikchunia kroppenstedtii TaxID=1121721 RepID=UPI0003AAD1DC|nr:DUF2075 domain-containing protein [Jongsikchunia kroppenstedtii]